MQISSVTVPNADFKQAKSLVKLVKNCENIAQIKGIIEVAKLIYDPIARENALNEIDSLLQQRGFHEKLLAVEIKTNSKEKIERCLQLAESAEKEQITKIIELANQILPPISFTTKKLWDDTFSKLCEIKFKTEQLSVIPDRLSLFSEKNKKDLLLWYVQIFKHTLLNNSFAKLPDSQYPSDDVDQKLKWQDAIKTMLPLTKENFTRFIGQNFIDDLKLIDNLDEILDELFNSDFKCTLEKKCKIFIDQKILEYFQKNVGSQYDPNNCLHIQLKTDFIIKYLYEIIEEFKNESIDENKLSFSASTKSDQEIKDFISQIMKKVIKKSLNIDLENYLNIQLSNPIEFKIQLMQIKNIIESRSLNKNNPFITLPIYDFRQTYPNAKLKGPEIVKPYLEKEQEIMSTYFKMVFFDKLEMIEFRDSNFENMSFTINILLK